VKRLLLILCACAGARGGGGGTADTRFGVSYPDQPYTTKAGKRFYAQPRARCTRDDGSDARWAMTGARVARGALPAGVSLEDGALSGTPTTPGTYSATITVVGNTCAGKTQPDQQLDVTITVR
jgi:hypothetical protein